MPHRVVVAGRYVGWPASLCAAVLLTLRRWLIALANRLVPRALPLYEITTGVAQTQIVAAFVRLGVADALARGHNTVAALSQQTGAHADVLSRFLHVACTLGLLRRTRRGRYRTTRLGRALHPACPTGMAAFAQYMASSRNVQAWSNLPGVLQTGQDAFAALGTDVWSDLAARPDEQGQFAQAMTALARMDGPALAHAYPFSRHRTICDVGGGQGAFLSAILSVHPTLQGQIVDHPAVVASAAAARRPDARLAFVAGDFFQAWPTGADAYVLRQILHDWSDARCQRILARARAAMRPQSRLLVVETLFAPNGPDYWAAIKDLTMGVLCSGRERDRAAFQRLLDAAGLRLRRVWPAAAPVAILEISVA